MILGQPAAQYRQSDEAERNRVIEAADKMNWKRDGDMELVGTRVILRDASGNRWALIVDTDGHPEFEPV